eukprot:PhF_6_TR11512/c1_g2_i5/m.18413
MNSMTVVHNNEMRLAAASPPPPPSPIRVHDEVGGHSNKSSLNQTAEITLAQLRQLTEELREKEAYIFKLEGRLMKGGSNVQKLHDQIDSLHHQIAAQERNHDSLLQQFKKLQSAGATARGAELNRRRGSLVESHYDADVFMDLDSCRHCSHFAPLEQKLSQEVTRCKLLEASISTAEARLENERKRAKEIEEENVILYQRLGAARDHVKQLESEITQLETKCNHNTTTQNLKVEYDAFTYHARRQI